MQKISVVVWSDNINLNGKFGSVSSLINFTWLYTYQLNK